MDWVMNGVYKFRISRCLESYEFRFSCDHVRVASVGIGKFGHCNEIIVTTLITRSDFRK